MRKIRFAVIASLVALLAPLSVMAQACSTEESETLLNCIDTGIATCAAATTDCNALALSLTLSDVEDIAIEKCCTKSKKGARKSCLNREKLKYSPRASSGEQRVFFTAARSTITALVRSDCNDNAYSSGF